MLQSSGEAEDVIYTWMAGWCQHAKERKLVKTSVEENSCTDFYFNVQPNKQINYKICVLWNAPWLCCIIYHPIQN